jgi:Leucine-rich repeat (LRR) protein
MRGLMAIFSRETIAFFFSVFGFNNLLQSAGTIAALIGSAGGLVKLIYSLIRKIREHIIKKGIDRNVFDFYTESEISRFRKKFVQTRYCTDIPSDQEIKNKKGEQNKKLIPLFLNHYFKHDDYKYFFILGDSGMGKTAFLINLYAEYSGKIFGRRYNIELVPLAFDKAIDRIKELPDKNQTILLLDALDEDMEAVKNYSARIDKIMDEARTFRCVIITCRTQFFPLPTYISKIKKYAGTGYYEFKRYYIAPFNNHDINTFLNKKFGFIFHYRKKKKAKSIVYKSPDLMIRPMLLNYINDLLDNPDNEYEFKADIYKELINKWLAREANRQNYPEQKAEFLKKLKTFSYLVAKKIYESRTEYNGQCLISKDDINAIGKEFNLDIASWKLTGRSLLNCNLDMQYMFAHRSILEYYLAIMSLDAESKIVEVDENEFSEVPVFIRSIQNRSISGIISDAKGYFSIYQQNGITRELTEIYKARLDYIYELSIESSHDIDLEGLRYLPNLNLLTIINSTITDPKPLCEMGKLRSLTLDNNNLNGIGFISSLPYLRNLSLKSNNIKDIYPLTGLKKLMRLDLSGNDVSDISPLLKLKNLKKVCLTGNRFVDIDDLIKK